MRRVRQKIAELESRLIGKYLVITTRSGRKVRIHHQAPFMLYVESMKAVDRDLRPRDLSGELLAIADSEFDPDWPCLLQNAWWTLTDNGKHVGLKAVMQFLRTKPDSRFLMKDAFPLGFAVT
jgi:hypothetical protein